MKSILALFFCFQIHSLLSAQQTAPSIQRIDPSNWWVGMKNHDVQLLVYGPQAGTLSYSISYAGVKLLKTSKKENPNYAFLDLTISSSAKPGMLRIT